MGEQDRRIFESQEQSLGQPRVIICGGENLTADMAQVLADFMAEGTGVTPTMRQVPTTQAPSESDVQSGS